MDMDFSGMFGDGYYPLDPDPNAVNSVIVVLNSDTVLCETENKAEVSGYVVVRNYNEDPLEGIPLELCVSDSNVSLFWINRSLADTTDVTGRVQFALHCSDCAGEVMVEVSNYWGADCVVFLPAERKPARLEGKAIPETLFVAPAHSDSFTLQLSVFDENNQPVSGFIVRSSYLNWNRADCSAYRARIDTAGTVTASFDYAFQVYYPYSDHYHFVVGGLRDSIRVTFMPWDSARGS